MCVERHGKRLDAFIWDLAVPVELTVRCSRPSSLKSDPTVLQFRLPTGSFGVAVEDVLSNECVYLPDYGVFVTRDPAPITLADYKRKIAGRKTVLQQVRELPDQTLEQAMARTHHAAQCEGPVMLSLACDNAQVCRRTRRNGAVSNHDEPYGRLVCNRRGIAPTVWRQRARLAHALAWMAAGCRSQSSPPRTGRSALLPAHVCCPVRRGRHQSDSA